MYANNKKVFSLKVAANLERDVYVYFRVKKIN